MNNGKYSGHVSLTPLPKKTLKDVLVFNLLSNKLIKDVKETLRKEGLRKT